MQNPVYTDYIVECDGYAVMERSFDSHEHPWPLPKKGGKLSINNETYIVKSIEHEYFDTDTLQGCIVSINAHKPGIQRK